MVWAVNEEDFANPISRRLARGESLTEGSSQVWLDPFGREKAAPVTNGGIIDPCRYEIAKRTSLYRFASVTDGAEQALRGGWWLERRELDHLIRYAEVNNKTLGYAVRLLCCVPPEWGSALNFIVCVKAAGVIAAWRGLANSAAAKYTLKQGGPNAIAGVTRINAQNDVAALRVPQLFIPGTKRDGATRVMFLYEGQWQTEGATDWIHGSGE
jgi:hypothetical protein